MQYENWYVIRVAPQSEFRALHAITQSEHPAMLPFEEKWVTNPRTKKSDTKKFPLFPSYVFAPFAGATGDAVFANFSRLRTRINEASKLAGKAPPILGICGYGQTPERLRSDEFAYLQTISREAGAKPSPQIFTVGQTIEVMAGPFQGQNGVVDSVSREKVRVMMRVFNAMAPVELQLNCVVAA
jgi:transcription antitermination factor NusG